MILTIGYLYPDLMNIYGDRGNIVALQKRAQWRGIKVDIKNISLKDRLKPKDADLFFFGGGQDQQQELVSRDLVSSIKGKIIKYEVERGVPLLAICGGYQLLGEYYQPKQGDKLEGVGLFPAYTIAGGDRMIGNIVIELVPDLFTVSSNNFLVGFENHSGRTYLQAGAKALGRVIKGRGNNGQDQTEGCIYKNAVGCYMHGSLLPKNPVLADWLLKKALEVKYGQNIALEPLDDTLENQARQAIIHKFG